MSVAARSPEETAGDPGGVQALLTELQDVVCGARSLPMTASCVLNRAGLLESIAAVQANLPYALLRAQEVLADREAVLREGRREADRIVESAATTRETILAGTEIRQVATTEAVEIVRQARTEAEALRTAAEHYVDAKLATFEIVLAKTLTAVERGRAQLHGEHELDLLREPGDSDAAPTGPPPTAH